MKCKLLLLSLAILFAFTQCNFQKIGRDTGRGFNENTEALGRNLLSGVNQGLADPAFRANLNSLVDSLVSTAGISASRSARLLLDSLLSDRLLRYTAQLVEETTGRQLRSNVAAITSDLQQSLAQMTGATTRENVRLLVATALQELTGSNLQAAVARIRDELTGTTLRQNLGTLRDSLLNEKTNTAIRAIVDSALLTVDYRLKNNINKSLQDNLSFVQRNATTLLIILGVMALVIIVVVWRLKEKYAKMTTVLASQIHDIPNQQAYDDLTYRIKEKAVIAGVEPSLRKVLSQNGLLGKESRDSWQAKKTALMENKN